MILTSVGRWRRLDNCIYRGIVMRTSVLPVACSVACLGFLSVAARAADTVGSSEQVARQAAKSLYSDVREHVLPNGLRVYLKPVPSSPVVSIMVAYKVGSADEDLDHTGLSHYLEHLMFKGTDRIKPGDIDHFTLVNGGANNASTSEDATIYFFDFAADRWQHALDLWPSGDRRACPCSRGDGGGHQGPLR
jgi:zinc protease